MFFFIRNEGNIFKFSSFFISRILICYFVMVCVFLFVNFDFLGYVCFGIDINFVKKKN